MPNQDVDHGRPGEDGRRRAGPAVMRAWRTPPRAAPPRKADRWAARYPATPRAMTAAPTSTPLARWKMAAPTSSASAVPQARRLPRRTPAARNSRPMPDRATRAPANSGTASGTTERSHSTRWKSGGMTAEMRLRMPTTAMAAAARARTARRWPALSAGGSQTAPPGSDATTQGRGSDCSRRTFRRSRADPAGIGWRPRTRRTCRSEPASSSIQDAWRTDRKMGSGPTRARHSSSTSAQQPVLA